MKPSIDCVTCRVIEIDSFVSVTHTLKDQSRQRVSDIQSVTDLLEALPSLNEPIIEAIPYEAEYYNKWARVVRNEAASRASLRPVTVTVKSWTLLHSIPTPPHSRMETSNSRTQAQVTSTKSPISSSKSLDSIIEHYNNLFPPESQTISKDTPTKHKDTPNKSDSQSKTKNDTTNKESTNSGNIYTNENLKTDSLRNCYTDGKSSPRTLSPKGNLSVLSNVDRSRSPDPIPRTEKISRKNSLQVPLPTNLVSIQWPPALCQSDISFKSTQFPACSSRRSSGTRSPRLKSPDPFHCDQDSSFPQSPYRGSMIRLWDNELPAFHKYAKRCSERSLSYNDSSHIQRFGSVSPHRLSTKVNISASIENISDCKSTIGEVNSNILPHLGAELSICTPKTSNSDRGVDLSQRKINLAATASSYLSNSQERKYLERDCLPLTSQSSIYNRSEVNVCERGKSSRSHHRRRSRKLNQGHTHIILYKRDVENKSNKRDTKTLSYNRDLKFISDKQDSQTPFDKRDAETKTNKQDSQTLSDKRETQTVPEKRELPVQNLTNKPDSQTLSEKRDSQTLSEKRDSQTLSEKRDSQTLSEKRKRFSRSKNFRHRQDGPPMIQLLDLNDLRYIFDKAANVQRKEDVAANDVPWEV